MRLAFVIGSVVALGSVLSGCAADNGQAPEEIESESGEKDEAILTPTSPTAIGTETGTKADGTCLTGRVYFAGRCRTVDWFKTTFPSSTFEGAGGPLSASEASKSPIVLVQEKTTTGWLRTFYTSATVAKWVPKRSGYGTLAKIEFRAGKDAEGNVQTKVILSKPVEQVGAVMPPFHVWRVAGTEVTTYRGSRGTETCQYDGRGALLGACVRVVPSSAGDLAMCDAQAAAAGAQYGALCKGVAALNGAQILVGTSLLCMTLTAPGVLATGAACIGAGGTIGGAVWLMGNGVCDAASSALRESVRVACYDDLQEACETAGKTMCNGSCVDTKTDEAHCGMCNNACSGVCNNGLCEELDEPAIP